MIIFFKQALLIIFFFSIVGSFVLAMIGFVEWVELKYYRIRYGKKIDLCRSKCRRTIITNGLELICIEQLGKKVEKSGVPKSCPYYLEHLL